MFLILARRFRTPFLAITVLFAGAFVLPASAQGDPAYPNILKPWESDFGEIYWAAGYYDTPEKTLSGKITFDVDLRKWVFNGRWGRIESDQIVEKGNVYLVFDDKAESYLIDDSTSAERDVSTFSGHFTDDTAERRLPWRGEIGAARDYTGKSLKAHFYSWRGTPYQGPSASVSTFNHGLLEQVKALRADRRWSFYAERDFKALGNDVTGVPASQTVVNQKAPKTKPLPKPEALGDNLAKFVEGVTFKGGQNFLRNNRNEWIEYTSSWQEKFKFELQAKEEHKVKLYDRSRDMHIHLDIKNMIVTFATGNSAHTTLASIEDVTYVRHIKTAYTDTGRFRRLSKSGREWVQENSLGDRLASFEFVLQNKDIILLNDASRDLFVALDFANRKVRSYTGRNNSRAAQIVGELIATELLNF